MDAPANRLNLAHEPPFHLGELRVEPALRLVWNGETSEIVEPRVMKLLVALHAAGGQILSRDDLVEQCWDGRIVGENAIQRAISHARKIAGGIGGGSFDIQTVRGVGYRLRAAGIAAPADAPHRHRALWLSRRAVLTGAAAASVAVVAGTALLTRGNRPSGLALKLYSEAEAARREQDGDVSIEQAVAHYLEAVRASPDFADAWSGLALAYCDLLEVAPVEQLERVAGLANSAAVRALDIDRSNVNARLARLSIRPPFRRWMEAENAALPLWKQDPRNWTVAAYLGRLAAETGRFEAALEHFGRAVEVEPLLPRIFGQLAYANWAVGRMHEAEQLLDNGMKHWPRSWFLWELRFQFLAFQGETGAAERQITNASATPWNLAPTGVPKRLQLIGALETRDRAEIEKAKATHLAEAVEFEWAVPRVSLVLAALDCRDELFDLLRGYYLEVGPYARKISTYSRRPTYFLFLPPMRPVHSDRRFAALLAAIGLDRF